MQADMLRPINDRAAAIARALCQEVNNVRVVFHKDVHELLEVVGVDDHVLVQIQVIDEVHGRSLSFVNGLTLFVGNVGQHTERIPQLEQGKRPLHFATDSCSRSGISLA